MIYLIFCNRVEGSAVLVHQCRKGKWAETVRIRFFVVVTACNSKPNRRCTGLEVTLTHCVHHFQLWNTAIQIRPIETRNMHLSLDIEVMAYRVTALCGQTTHINPCCKALVFPLHCFFEDALLAIRLYLCLSSSHDDLWFIIYFVNSKYCFILHT